MAPTSYSTSAEIIMHEGVTAVYRSNVDLFFYVLGAQGENEVRRVARWQGRPASSSLLSSPPPPPTQLMLMGVLNGLYDTVSSVLRCVGGQLPVEGMWRLVPRTSCVYMCACLPTCLCVCICCLRCEATAEGMPCLCWAQPHPKFSVAYPLSLVCGWPSPAY